MKDWTNNEQKALYRVHYKDHDGGTWSVIVMASSAQVAEELVSKEDDCKRVVCSEVA